MKRILLLLLVMGILLLNACADSTTPPAPAPTPEPSQTIATFTGSGEAVTEQFFIQGHYGSWDFVVSWECTPEYVNAFGLYVHLITVNNPTLESNPSGVVKGTMKVHYFEEVPSGEAPFVIEVIAPRNCNWTIEVKQ